jgi:hypothetical protein
MAAVMNLGYMYPLRRYVQALSGEEVRYISDIVKLKLKGSQIVKT